MISAWLPGLLITLFWVAVLYFLKRYGRYEAAQKGLLKEYEKGQAIGAIFGPPAFGVILIVVILASWNSIPPDNEPVIYFMFGIAALLLIYGLYKWHQFRQQQNK